jgi:hypothetical protein
MFACSEVVSGVVLAASDLVLVMCVCVSLSVQQWRNGNGWADERCCCVVVLSCCWLAVCLVGLAGAGKKVSLQYVVRPFCFQRSRGSCHVAETLCEKRASLVTTYFILAVSLKSSGQGEGLALGLFLNFEILF